MKILWVLIQTVFLAVAGQQTCPGILTGQLYGTSGSVSGNTVTSGFNTWSGTTGCPDTLFSVQRHQYLLNLGTEIAYGTLSLSLCNTGTNYDTMLYIGRGCPYNYSSFQCIASDDDSNCGVNGLYSIIQTTVTQPVNYILVGGYSTSRGTYYFSWSYSPLTPLPSITATTSHTFVPSVSSSRSITGSVTESFSNSKSNSASRSETATSSASISDTPSGSSSATGTATPSASISDTLSGSSSATGTATPSASISDTPSESSSPTGSGTSSSSATGTSSSSSSATGTSSSSSSATGTSSSSSSATGTSSSSSSTTGTSSSSSSATGSSSSSSSTTGTNTMTSTSTSSSTVTNTPTSSISEKYSQTQTHTPSASQTETGSGSSSQTNTASNSQSNTHTSSQTETQTPTASASQTETPSSSQTETQTSTPSESQTGTSSSSQTNTPSNSQTNTQSGTQSNSHTGTESFTRSETGTHTGTDTFTSSGSSSQTGTGSFTNSGSSSNTGTESVTRTGSSSQTGTGSFTSSGSSSQTGTGSNFHTPTPTCSSTKTSTQTSTQSSTKTSSQTSTETPTQSSTKTSTYTTSQSLIQLQNNTNNQVNNILNGISIQNITLNQTTNIVNSLSTFSDKSDSSNVLNILNQLASSLIAQNLTTEIRINTPEFVFIALPPPLQNATTSYSVSNDVKITIPPIGGRTIGAISVVAWGNNSFKATNSSSAQPSSPVLSISFTDSSGAPLHIRNLSPPLILQNAITKPRPIPNITFIPECVFWNTSILEWSSDGCYVTSNTSISIECACNHLTDFASRFQAIAETNKKVFENAASVYTLDGLRKYANYYIFVGTFFATLLTIFIYITHLNNENTVRYVKTLAKFPEITILQHFYKGPFFIDRYYPAIKLHPKETSDTHFIDPYKGYSWFGKLCWIWYNRIFYEHAHLSFFFKFDPRIPRQLRALFVFIAILNTLFVTCLLYGYSHNPNGDAMTIAESVVLSVLTSVINVPIVLLFGYLLNIVGAHEYKWRYPYIYDELKSRHLFEELCSNREVSELWPLIKSRQQLLKNLIKYEVEYNGVKFRTLWRFVAAKKSGIDDTTSDLVEEFRKKVVDYKVLYNPYNNWYKYLPVHTKVGWAGLAVGLGYLLWCLNYILIFGAAESGSDKVFFNFMASEVIAIMISQPLALFLAPIIGYIANKLIKMCSKKGNGKELHSYSNIYFFSDPLASVVSTSLSISFGYWLFLRGIIEAGVKKSDKVTLEISAAPPKAIVASLEEDDGATDEEKAIHHAKKAYHESEKDMCITVLYYLLRLENMKD